MGIGPVIVATTEGLRRRPGMPVKTEAARPRPSTVGPKRNRMNRAYADKDDSQRRRFATLEPGWLERRPIGGDSTMAEHSQMSACQVAGIVATASLI